MTFDLEKAIEVLDATPAALRGLLGGLSEEWTASSGDHAAWQPFDVVGHLIHGEATDWIPRARIILEQGGNRTFIPFDRLAQFERSKGKTLSELLDEFERLRRQNIGTLSLWDLTEEHLSLAGTHPELGEVTLRQLLATWVVHDLNHVSQIARVMAARFRDEVGVWREYLSILDQ